MCNISVWPIHQSFESTSFRSQLHGTLMGLTGCAFLSDAADMGLKDRISLTKDSLLRIRIVKDQSKPTEIITKARAPAPDATKLLLKNLKLERMPVEGDVIELTSDGIWYNPNTHNILHLTAGDKGTHK